MEKHNEILKKWYSDHLSALRSSRVHKNGN